MKRSDERIQQVRDRGTGTDAGAARPWRPMGSCFTVERLELLRETVRLLAREHIVVVVAPDGFGKTAFLLQCVEEVMGDPGRGRAYMMDAGQMSCLQVVDELERLRDESDSLVRPLVALDNVPTWTAERCRACIEELSRLIDAGFDVVLSCRPHQRDLLYQLRDLPKINAQALKVRPKEYSTWMQTFSIPHAADVYRLTQGVPALIAALSVDDEGSRDEVTFLDACVAALYRGILEELEDEPPELLRLARLLVLLGSGSADALRHGGLEVPPECWVRLTHDYPVFGYDPVDHAFTCLGQASSALGMVRQDVAQGETPLVLRAVRTLLHENRIDEAVALSTDYLDLADQLAVVGRHALKLVLAGHASWVASVAADADQQGLAPAAPVRLAFARYAAALTLGNYKLAREMAGRLRTSAHEIVGCIDAAEWDCVVALAGIWKTCSGIELPQIAFETRLRRPLRSAAHLRLFSVNLREALGGREEGSSRGPRRQDGGGRARRRGNGIEQAKEPHIVVDIPAILTACADLLGELSAGSMAAPDERDAALGELEQVLRSRRLLPILMIVRTVLSMRRLFAGEPVVDERVFTDAETLAIRTSDQPLQLMCLMLEGWQSLSLGHAVSAQFRGAQVLRLSGRSATLVTDWALMLERAAHLRSSSRLAVCEEAEALDLAPGSRTPAEAWATALGLSAAHLDGELAAWYSLHQAELMEPSFRMPARLALQAMGDRSEPIRRLIPARMKPSYVFEVSVQIPSMDAPEKREDIIAPRQRQVAIKLFGGFKAEREGQTLTDALWRRRKTSILAARLVLATGSFIGRKVLMEELWPQADYQRARDSLYSALTALRHAMGQSRQGGPQYVLVQGEGVAINTDYVLSDVMLFNQLARDVLLRRTGISRTDLIESCLKIEQLYAGALYVPHQVTPAYFKRMRAQYQMKFADCMLKGIKASVEENDLASATWLTDAALHQAPDREDVVREAMQVFDLSGRHGEVRELYHSHMAYLESNAGGMPEPQTTLLFEKIMGYRQPRARHRA